MGILQARILTEVFSHALLQGMFPTQWLNPGLSHCRQILYQLSNQGSPRILEWVAYPFSRGYSQPRNQTGVSCIASRFFTSWATREVQGIQGKGLIYGALCLTYQCHLLGFDFNGTFCSFKKYIGKIANGIQQILNVLHVLNTLLVFSHLIPTVLWMRNSFTSVFW